MAMGNPAPLGLLASGITTALLMYVQMGWVEIHFQELIYGYAIFLGGLCQFLVGIFLLFQGSSFSFAVFCCFGAFWLGWAAVFKETASTTSSFGDGTYPNGTAANYATWGVLLSCFLVIALRLNLCLIIILALLVITFFLLAVSVGIGNDEVGKAAGYFGFFAAFVFFYTGIAELVNEEWGYQVLPGLAPIYSPERQDITSDHIDKLISYDSKTNTMLLSFRGLQINSAADVRTIKESILANIMEANAPGDKVHVVVDYKDVVIADDLIHEYWEMATEMQRNYYRSLTRFHVTSFGTKDPNAAIGVSMASDKDTARRQSDVNWMLRRQSDITGSMRQLGDTTETSGATLPAVSEEES